jgi:hypothetical protein
VREDLLGQPERRDEVEVERLADRLEWLALGRLVAEHSVGDVYQDLRAAKLVSDLGDNLADQRHVKQIAADGHPADLIG